MPLSEAKRAAFLQLLREFLDEAPGEMVISAQRQNGVRRSGTVPVTHTPFGQEPMQVQAHAYEHAGEIALIFIAHHVENTPNIPRIVRDG